jgi:hypothetical protein
MNLNLMEEMPRGYGKVINKSERVNRHVSHDCSDHYNLCPIPTKKGNCEGGNGEKE